MAERPIHLQRDPFGDVVNTSGSWHWNWRNDHIMRWINNFVRIARSNTIGNVDRLEIYDTGRLKRSLFWQTFATHNGDEQVFRAQYIYYAKYVELAVGWHNRYNGPVPTIPGKQWPPIPVPTRKMKGRPFVVTEMRRQAKKFMSYASNNFQFAGLVTMIYSMGGNEDPAIRAAVNRALFWASTRDKFQR